MVETSGQYLNLIKAIANAVKSEPDIKKMRDNISEGILKTGTRQYDVENRQVVLEKDFVKVQQDASSVSPSGAEIVVARGEYDTLGSRLTEEEKKVTAQFQQTADVLKNIYYQAPLPNGVDDSVIVKETLEYCIEHHYTALFLPGVYVVAPGVFSKPLKNKQQLKIKGFGKKTIFKRKENTTTSDWKRLFVFESDETNTEDVDLIQIEDIFVDSNAKNQQAPSLSDNFEFEHCADITISGKENSRINNVIINNLYCDDGVADHIYFPGSQNCYVDFVNIDHMEVFTRNRTRSDVTFTGTARNVYINNFVGQKIETEINNAGGEPGILKINNSIVKQTLDLGGAMKNITISLDNVSSLNNTLLSAAVGSINNSKLVFAGNKRINWCELFFQNVFIQSVPNADGVVTPITVYGDINGHYTKFKGCTFEILSEGNPETTFAVRAVAVEPQKHDINILEVIDCEFDERFNYSISLDRSGTVLLDNNNYAGKTKAVRFNSSLDRVLKLTIKGGNYENCSGFMTVDGVLGLVLRLESIVQNEANSSVQSTGGAMSYAEPILLNNRVILTTSDPSQKTIAGFKNDKYVRESAPNSGQAYEWVSLRTHHADTQTKPLVVMP